VRERAIALRVDGRSVPEISRELEIARSTAWLLTRDVHPTAGFDARARRAEAGREYWRHERARRAEVREEAVSAATQRVGDLTERELLLAGAVAYWAEGTKAKPWHQRERLTFTNSDPSMIKLFLAWLDLVAVDRQRITYRVSIHESADIEQAVRYWADVVGIATEDFARTTVKRHKPTTPRRNTGEAYRGCLVVNVRRSADEYRLAEGLWAGVAAGVEQPPKGKVSAPCQT
jgi:hypothetical protein